MSNAHAATPDIIEAMWASIQHGVHNRLSLKEAYRLFAMGQDPNETEEEFEARWQTYGRPMLLDMKAEEDRWIAMTDEERENVMEETAARHGVELTPDVRALTLQMRQGRVDLLRDL